VQYYWIPEISQVFPQFVTSFFNQTLLLKTGIGSSPARLIVPAYDLALAADKLSGQIIMMLPAVVMSSTAIKLLWEVRRNQRFIEGFHVRYRRTSSTLEADVDSRVGRGQDRVAAGNGLSGSEGDRVEFTVETIQSSATTMYTLTSLDKNTWYELSVRPFYFGIIGQDSNTVRVKTLEDGKPSCVLSILNVPVLSILNVPS